MYYILMYGSVIVGAVAIAIAGLGMIFTKADKIELKAGENREDKVKRMRTQGIMLTIIGIIITIMVIYLYFSNAMI